MEESTSLQNLNPLVLAEPVGWWPLAAGWYPLIALLLAVMAGVGWKHWKRWQANRYRREALQALNAADSARATASILKRAALAAYPRTEVAGLSGPPWHRFLDQTSGETLFCNGIGPLLDQAAYGGQSLAGNELKTVMGTAERWVRRHKPAKAKR